MNRQSKELKITNVGDIKSLKINILSTLRMYDHKKDCEKEFYDRIKRYRERHSNEEILITFDWDRIERTIRNKVEIENIEVKYPDGFEFGQPHMAWGAFPSSKTMKEIELEKEKIKTITDNEIKRLKLDIDNLIIETGFKTK